MDDFLKKIGISKYICKGAYLLRFFNSNVEQKIVKNFVEFLMNLTIPFPTFEDMFPFQF